MLAYVDPQRAAAAQAAAGALAIILAAAIGLVFCVACGAVIGGMKNQAFLGALLGLFLGPFGILIACLLPPGEPPRSRRGPYRRYPPLPNARERAADSFLDQLR